MSEIKPMSYNDFCEAYEDYLDHNDALAAFSMYSLGYWLQQNQDKVGSRDYLKLEEMYENPLA